MQIGIRIIQIRQTINHKWKAVSRLSINFPEIQWMAKALMPKHCEYNAIAEPLYRIGDDFIIASDAVGRNIHKAIVRGMKAISINIYPLRKRFDRDNKIKPVSNDIRHNLNLKDELLFLKI